MENLKIDYSDKESQMVEVENFEDFVKYNIGDVKRIIFSRYRNIINHHNTIEDMTQDVLAHLLRNDSIRKFDSSRGVKFSTYIYACINYYMISFPLRKTINKHYEKNNVEYIDEVFSGVSKLSEYLGSYEDNTESNIDLERVRVIAENLDAKKKIMNFKRRVSYLDVFNMLIDGYKERDIAKKHKVTQTCIALKRKEIIEVARKELGLTEEAHSF